MGLLNISMRQKTLQKKYSKRKNVYNVIFTVKKCSKTQKFYVVINL